MTTKLDRPLKRELEIDDMTYTLTIAPAGLRLVPKGGRKGYELDWRAVVSGDAALATALNASISGAGEPRATRPGNTKARKRRLRSV